MGIIFSIFQSSTPSSLPKLEVVEEVKEEEEKDEVEDQQEQQELTEKPCPWDVNGPCEWCSNDDKWLMQ